MILNFNCRYTRGLLLALLMMMLLGLLSACDSEEKPIPLEGEAVIYVVGPLSGPDASKGQAQAAGARLAAVELNQAGGLLGREVIIKQINDAGELEGALKAAQEVAEAAKNGEEEEEEEDVVGLIMFEGSDSQLEAIKKIDLSPESALNALIVAPVSTNPVPVALENQVALDNQNTPFFRLSAPNISQAAETANLLQEQNLHDVVVVHQSTPYGKALAEAFNEATLGLDVNVMGTFELEPDTFDYADTVAQVIELNPAALFYAGEDAETAFFLSELFGFEFHGKLFGSDRALLYRVVDELSCQAEGMTFNSLLPEPSTVMSAEQLASYSAQEGRKAELYTVAGYSGVEFIVKAFEAAGSLDAAQAAQQARQTTISTLMGEIAFDAEGKRERPPLYFFQVEGKEFKESSARTVGTGAQASQETDTGNKPLLDGPFAADKQPIIFAGLDWDSAQFNNYIARIIIESGYGYPTHAVEGSSVPLFQSLRKGDLDVNMELWLPNSQELYDKAIDKEQIVDLGQNFDNATQGWFVPSYVTQGDPARGIEAVAPELKSVADLEQYTSLFASPEQPGIGRLMDGSPGWFSYKIDCMKLKSYRLDDSYAQITTGSESALFAELENAYNKGEPILMYFTEPTWPKAKFDLQQLEEPDYSEECWQSNKACAFPSSVTKIVTASDFPERVPEVADFLSAFSMDSDDISRILLTMKENELTAQEAASRWLKENEEIWSQWVPNDVGERVKEVIDD